MTTLPAESHPGARQARACLVKLAGSRFAVEVRYAREVVVFDGLTVVPLAPPHLLGVVNLRGSVMPRAASSRSMDLRRPGTVTMSAPRTSARAASSARAAW